MAKIKNRIIYPIRQLTKEDTFPGTKTYANGKTVQYDGQGVVDIALAEVIIALGDRVIIGGYAHKVGYTFTCWAEKYVIDGVLYIQRLDGEVTLDPSHPTLDRIDLLTVVANPDPTLHGFGKVTGVPSETPLRPDTDTNSVQLTFVQVKAGSSEPENLSKITVFNENTQTPTEWDTDKGASANVDLENTEQASLGTKSIKYALAQADDDTTKFLSGIGINHTNFSLLKFDIYLLNEVEHRLWVRFLDQAGTSSVGDGYLVLKNSYFGFNKELLNQWQTVYMTKEDFNILLSSPLLSQLYFQNKTDNAGFHIDNIELQFGLEPVGILPTQDYSLEETPTQIRLLNEGVIISTVSKGTAEIFGNVFTHRKSNGDGGDGNIELNDVAMNGMNSGNTKLISLMVFLNTDGDMDKNNTGNWDIITQN